MFQPMSLARETLRFHHERRKNLLSKNMIFKYCRNTVHSFVEGLLNGEIPTSQVARAQVHHRSSLLRSLILLAILKAESYLACHLVKIPDVK